MLHANSGQTPLEILKQLELHNESVVLFLVDQHVPDMNGACLTGGIWLLSLGGPEACAGISSATPWQTCSVSACSCFSIWLYSKPRASSGLGGGIEQDVLS